MSDSTGAPPLSPTPASARDHAAPAGAAATVDRTPHRPAASAAPAPAGSPEESRRPSGDDPENPNNDPSGVRGEAPSHAAPPAPIPLEALQLDLQPLLQEGLWSWPLAGGRVHCTPRALELLGLSPDAPDASNASGALAHDLQDWLARVHPEDRATLDGALQRCVRGELLHLDVFHRVERARGDYRRVRTRARLARDGVTLIGSISDPDDAARHDALTGLPNRGQLRQRLSEAFARFRRDPERRFALLSVDLDDFKVINESLGHRVGDQLLLEVAKRLQLCFRSGDTVARHAGDEFMVLMEGVNDAAGLERVVQRVVRYIASRYRFGDLEAVSSASVGVVSELERYRDIDELLRDADIAMHHAKDRDEGYAFFHPSMYQHASRRQGLELEMRRALERDEFTLFYQPIYSLHDRRTTGFEALLRWKHPQRGLLPPAEFLELAEETGLIVPIGEWVLRRVCTTLQQQPECASCSGFTVNVNLSSRQLARPGFPDTVRDILRETGVAPERLLLEVTEHDLMSDSERCAEALHRIKALGVRIALDDFGTGHSSLAYLHQLPLDVLKIDRSFTLRLTDDRASQEIMRTFVTLGKSLQLETVSEGIETGHQEDIVLQLQCTYGQGYLYARPQPFLGCACQEPPAELSADPPPNPSG